MKRYLMLIGELSAVCIGFLSVYFLFLSMQMPKKGIFQYNNAIFMLSQSLFPVIPFIINAYPHI